MCKVPRGVEHTAACLRGKASFQMFRRVGVPCATLLPSFPVRKGPEVKYRLPSLLLSRPASLWEDGPFSHTLPSNEW